MYRPDEEDRLGRVARPLDGAPVPTSHGDGGASIRSWNYRVAYSTADEITRLTELRDRGVLTEQEFASAKVKAAQAKT